MDAPTGTRTDWVCDSTKGSARIMVALKNEIIPSSLKKKNEYFIFSLASQSGPLILETRRLKFLHVFSFINMKIWRKKRKLSSDMLTVC